MSDHEHHGHPSMPSERPPGKVGAEVPGGHLHDRHAPPTGGHMEQHAAAHKTGTLTRGRQGVVDLATADGLDPEQALTFAAAVESPSEHTLARAIVAEAERRGVRPPPVHDFQALPGRGARARLDGRELYVGGPALLAERNLNLPPDLERAGRRWGELGIDEYFAEVLPEHKVDKVVELQRRGVRVAMVGDGVNDAPALAQADVGIAIGAGTDVARAAAGIVLVRDAPRDVPRVVRLSRASYRKMSQNLLWAAGYNVVAIPLAAGVLAPFGIVLAPWFSGLLMSLSTVIVALNAQLLRRVDLSA